MTDRLTQPGRHDPAAWRKSKRSGKQRGVWVYLPAVELQAAGIDPHGPAPLFRTNGFRRSARGHSVIVSLKPQEPAP